MADNIINIDKFLSGYETALVGRFFGESIKLSDNYDFYDKIEILIPFRIITINYSFFLGFLSKVLENYTNENDFNKKYVFNTTDHIKNKIKTYVIKYYFGELI